MDSLVSGRDFDIYISILEEETYMWVLIRVATVSNRIWTLRLNFINVLITYS